MSTASPSTRAATSLPAAVTELPVEYLFRLHLELTKRHVSPGGPEGAEVFLGIIDGTFDGPRLHGRVVPLIGTSRAVLRGQGFARFDYTIPLVTDDHAAITITGSGISRLVDGRQPRVAFTFHTGASQYEWLNSVQAVGIGTGGHDEVTYEVYRLL
ncbi:MAG: DUF3237 family protein [Acidimicrobiales bacterium]